MSCAVFSYVGYSEVMNACDMLMKCVKADAIEEASQIINQSDHYFSIYFKNDGLDFRYHIDFYNDTSEIESFDTADKEYSGYENMMEFMRFILKEKKDASKNKEGIEGRILGLQGES